MSPGAAMALFDMSKLPSTRSMKPRTVWFCALANITNVFALAFMILYLTFGQYITAELCLYTSSAIILGALVTVVMFRKSQLSRSRLEVFMEPVRKGVIAHRGGAREGPENTLLALREVMYHFNHSVV